MLKRQLVSQVRSLSVTLDLRKRKQQLGSKISNRFFCYIGNLLNIGKKYIPYTALIVLVQDIMRMDQAVVPTFADFQLQLLLQTLGSPLKNRWKKIKTLIYHYIVYKINKKRKIIYDEQYLQLLCMLDVILYLSLKVGSISVPLVNFLLQTGFKSLRFLIMSSLYDKNLWTHHFST